MTKQAWKRVRNGGLWLCALCALPGGRQARAEEQQPTLLVDVDHRTAISLDGYWHTIVDSYQTGLYNFHHEVKKNGYFVNAKPTNAAPTAEYDFAASPTLQVPRDWNTQRPDLYRYEGLLWYQRDFEYSPKEHTRTFFHVGAANYRSYVWVNGQALCQHEGGFTPYDCDATALLHQGSNFAVIAVDNTRIPDGIPTLQTDWWNYGGITRDVSLVQTPEQFIDDYDLHLSRADRSTLEGWVHVVGATPGTPVSVAVPELNLHAKSTTDANSKAAFSIKTTGLKLWSPENPKLYPVSFSSGADTLQDEMGFRTIETKGTEILLNGKPIFLHGVSVHAEAPYRTGRAVTEQDIDTLLGWAQELGANYVRLAHYPHDQRMTRAADRKGLLVWSEIPVYWAVHFEDPAALAKAEQQLHEMIRRDRDKASVILWSVANETPITPERTKFLHTLADDAHTADGSRLVTAALLVRGEGNTKVVDDPLGQYLDVLGTNEYIGWYEGTPQSPLQTDWRISYSKPVIMSEFGGAAKAELHGLPTQRWTEEYQAEIYRNQIPMLNRIPQLRGMSPWVLMDFRSPSRLLPGLQDDFNRKGLISDQGVKKQAFYVLQKAYQDGSIGKAQ